MEKVEVEEKLQPLKWRWLVLLQLEWKAGVEGLPERQMQVRSCVSLWLQVQKCALLSRARV